MTIRIRHDETAESPRKNSTPFGTLAIPDCRHWSGLNEMGVTTTRDAVRTRIEAMREGTAVVLPVYAYVHSGIRFSTEPFSDRWDGGQCGWIYVPLAKVCDTFPRLGADLRWAEAHNILRGEIDELDKWISGDCWGWEQVDEKTCPECRHTEVDVVNSCWGYYGHDDVVAAAKEQRRTGEKIVDHDGKEIA